MFTGLIEEAGAVVDLAENKTAWRLRVRARKVLPSLRVGDSLAVNGCCLTVAKKARGGLEFDLLEETLRRTNLGDLRPGARVNLERSLPAKGRYGGHFVTGHIDCAGVVKVFERRGKNHYLRVAFPKEFSGLIVEKGSIALDGVSLTIAGAARTTLAVWLIPHTLAATNLGALKVGSRVNLEFDLLAKYLQRMTPQAR
jgi:riboflavin synthase